MSWSRILSWLGVHVAACAIFASSCERAAPRSSANTAVSIPREFSNRDWDTVFVAGGLPNDTLLIRPRTLATAGDRLVVFDYGDARVKSFLPDGRLDWTYGRFGEGPGEFINALDARVGPDGDVWIADGGTGRITVVGRDGQLRNTRSFPAAHTIQRLILMERDTLALPALPDPGTFWIDLDTAGVSSRGGLPDSVLIGAHPYFRQGAVAIAPDHRRWGIVFPFADRFLIFHEREHNCTGTLVKGNLPRAEVRPGEQPPISAAGAFWTDSTFVVLARDPDAPGDLKILDEFDSNCRYLRSHTLPIRALAVAWGGGTVFLAFEDPAPGILALRW